MFSNPLQRYFVVILFWILILPQVWAQDETPLPALNEYVSDETGTLSQGEIQQLSQKLKQLNDEKGSQLLVVLIPTTGIQPIEDYSIKLAEKTKAGREEVDDGLILLVAKEDRKVRIEVGYGLEGAITDAQSRLIIENSITPRFRNGDFYGGINAGVDDLIHLINGEPLPEKTQSSSGSKRNFGGFIPILLFLFIGIGPVLSKFLGKTKGGIVGGIAAFLIGWLIVSVGVGIMATVFFGFLYLFTVIGGGRGGRGGGGGFYGGGMFGGGFGGGSGGGGFGGGGFSGGGGSFGGGGATGGW